MLVLVLERMLGWWPDWRLAEMPAWPAARAAVALAIGLVVSLACGRRAICWLARHFREPIKCPSLDVARLHARKRATPTMGGLLLLLGLVAGTALLADPRNPYVLALLLACLGLGALGACDDLVKLRTARRGLSARTKLLGQTAVALAVSYVVFQVRQSRAEPMELAIPFTTVRVAIGFWLVPLSTLVIVAASNAINLTDGLDGLAAGCAMAALAPLGAIAWLAATPAWAGWLQVPLVPGADELIVPVALLMALLVGFLRLNRYPAAVFMGDVGSLPLGGAIGVLAVIARQELLLAVIGGVFVAEAASVILQVAVFRAAGHRVLRCAPLHHHFQLLGWAEPQIVRRFWTAAGCCALAGLMALGGYKVSGSLGPPVTQVTSTQAFR